MRQSPDEPYTATGWSQDDDALLAEHWGKLSSSKIGQKLNRSKNSVVGRAHRIGLPRLPSPLGRRENVSPEKRATQKREYLRKRKEAEKLGIPFVKKQRVVSLPLLASLSASPEEQQQKQDPISKTVESLSAVVADAKAARVSKASCCWPIGDPKDKDFKFCCEPALLGKSYCQAHGKIAWYRPVDRREWA